MPYDPLSSGSSQILDAVSKELQEAASTGQDPPPACLIIDSLSALITPLLAIPSKTVSEAPSSVTKPSV